MSAGSSMLTEDQLLCSICLHVFTDPVTIPCGHNFCKICITDHWKISDTCRCPNCNRLFNSMSDVQNLQINHLVSEMAAQFRRSAQEKGGSSRSGPQVSKASEVPCDVCTGTEMKALKSCLTCLASYCETHLEPHLTASRLKRHQLIDPVANPEGRMCMSHNDIADMFCRTDQMFVCSLCTVLSHETHDIVPLQEEYEGKKAELERTDAENQQRIQKKQLKIQEFKRSVELSREDADREIAVGVQVFTALKESVERRQAEFNNTTTEKHRQTEKQAEDYIQELEREISALKRRSSEVEQLSHAVDRLQLIQSFPSMRTAPPDQDWSEVRVCPPSYLGTVRAAVNQLEESLSEQMKKVFEAELEKTQQYAVDVTLDRDTAKPSLILSDDGKQVACPPRTKNMMCVFFASILAKQGFTSGRFYYEVQVERKTAWHLGVVRESVDWKSLFGWNAPNGWMIYLRSAKEYTATGDPPVHLSLKSQPKRVGVFVDYDEGLVSFYDVDAAALIYSFTGCVFTEKIYPFFSPGSHRDAENSAPLIITPVNPRVEKQI